MTTVLMLLFYFRKKAYRKGGQYSARRRYTNGDLTREVARDLRIRLMEAAAAIEEREPSNTLGGSRANLLERVAASNEETAGMDPPRLVLNNARE